MCCYGLSPWHYSSPISFSPHETSWLNNCPSQFKPIFYRRYVDDCFLLFRSSAHVLQFINYLNSQHANIKFTHETENNSTLSFFDIKINRSEINFTTSIYRKSTYTGLLTNFNSFIPDCYKKGLIFSLLFRYFNLYSSYFIFHSELQKLKQIFIKNEFPATLFNKRVISSLDKSFSSAPETSIAPKFLIYFLYRILVLLVFKSANSSKYYRPLFLKFHYASSFAPQFALALFSLSRILHHQCCKVE